MENIIIKLPISADEAVASNTKTKSKTLGDVELKYASLDDFEIFVKFLDNAKDDKDFAIQMLHHQLVTPELTLTEFSKISEEDLKKLANDFVKNDHSLSKYFKETTEVGFYAKFRNAIKEYNDREIRPLRASIKTGLASTLNIFQDFEDKYKKYIGQSSYITESISGISAAGKAFEESQLGVVKSLKPILENYRLTGTVLSEILGPQIDSWEKNVKFFATTLDNYASFFQNWDKRKQITDTMLAKLLKRYKWFIIPSMPYSFVLKVLKIGTKKGNQRKALNRLFIDFFTSNNFSRLQSLVDGWSKNIIFEPRMRILGNCISTLKTSRKGTNPSDLILPALIAQIDGIQQEFMKREGLFFDPNKRKWKDPKGDKIDWKKWFKDQTLDDRLDDLANDIFLNILFQKALPGKPLATPFTFNRHKILHGESLKYGRIDNTIRAFLILDFLATLSNRKLKK